MYAHKYTQHTHTHTHMCKILNYVQSIQVHVQCTCMDCTVYVRIIYNVLRTLYIIQGTHNAQYPYRL